MRWPVELGRGNVCPWPWLWRWLSGWPSACEWLLASRGGEMGSLLIFTGSGDVEGGGVLLDTAKWGRPLEKKGDLNREVTLKWTDPYILPQTNSLTITSVTFTFLLSSSEHNDVCHKLFCKIHLYDCTIMFLLTPGIWIAQSFFTSDAKVEFALSTLKNCPQECYFFIRDITSHLGWGLSSRVQLRS